MTLELMVATICPFCTVVTHYLKKRPDLDVKITNIDKDKEARERLMNEGGMLQVPCLFVDGKPMYESADIVKFLKGIEVK